MPEGLHFCNRGCATHGRKKTGEITRSGDTYYKKALIQNICFKVAPLRVHASPCKTAGRGFAELRHTRLQKCSPTGYC